MSCFILRANGQREEYVFSEWDKNVHLVAWGPNHTAYLLTGECFDNEITAIDSNLNILWKFDLYFNFHYTNISNAFVSTEQVLYIIGYNRRSDDVGGLESLFIAAIDSSGNLVKMFHPPMEINESVYYKYKPTAFMKDTVIYACFDKTIYSLNHNLDILEINHLSQNAFDLYPSSGETSVVFSRVDSGLIILGDHFQNLDTIRVEKISSNVLSYNNQLIFSTRNYLLKLEKKKIDTVFIFTVSESINFIQRSDSILLISLFSENKKGKLISVNLSTHQVATYFDLKGNEILKSFNVIDYSNLRLVGNIESNSWQGFISKNRLSGKNYDVGVTKVNNISSKDTIIFDIYHDYIYNLIVTVKNYGNTPVDSIWVYSDITGGFNCTYGYLDFVVSTGLRPGQSIDIPVKFLHYLAVKQDFCFFTVTADHFIDSDPSNDKGCGLISTISNEIKKKISIYPNPASNSISLILPKPSPAYYFLYNISGGLSQRGVLSHEFNIPLNDIQNGLYLLKIVQDKHQYIEKVEVLK